MPAAGLPIISIAHAEGRDVAESTHELYLAIFDEEDAARLALQEMRRRNDAAELPLVTSGLIERDAGGDIRIIDSGREQKHGFGTAGAALGIVAGILFPPSVVAGAIVGGVAGTIVGKAAEGREPGFRDNELKALGEALTPESFAVVVVAGPDHVATVESAAAGARLVMHRELPPDALDGLTSGVS